MIDIYELEKIKRITNRVYHNRDDLNHDQFYDMLMKIRDMVRK